MATTTSDTLNSLLRGELSAIETYEQALAKLGESKGAPELWRIHQEHRSAANSLRQHIQQQGGQPSKSAGVWGSFAKAVEGTAKLLGNDAALKALKEGEEHGVKQYESAAKDVGLPKDTQSLITSTLLPQTRAHIPVLDRLMAGLVERISPQEARQRVQSGQAILVCAYDSPEKFEQNHLEGAISLDQFKARADSIPKNRELIFYCA